MSGKLESALVIELVNTIKWGAAIEPEAEDGSLATVDPSKPLDITLYSRRDRELAYRDLVNATAVVKVSLHTESVWNTASIRPKLQGITGDDLPPTVGDLGSTDSTVTHVKNSSVPADAIAVDKDLAGRDALIYEVLARACEVFEEPPIVSAESGVEPGSAWSLAEGVDYGVQPSPSVPLDKNAFYLSDATLAQRDNYIAAYAAKLADILRNPFAFANRLYVRIDGTDARDVETYTLIRVYYESGETYDAGDDVYYGTKWYRALSSTTNPPSNTDDWYEVREPRLRTWVAEPALQFRNRIVYDTVAKTLQWFRETTDTTHIPQLYAMSIPGLFVGQTINTVAQVPDRKDCQFWRQKAARIDYSGTTATLLSSYQDTTLVPGGVHMLDSIGLTAPNELDVPLGVPVSLGHKYRISALVKPVNKVETYGVYNLLGLTSSDGLGAAFTGDYAPTTLLPGDEVTYQANLTPGTWYLSIDYTNASGSTSGFGLRIYLDDTLVADDTSPLLFQDDEGVALDNGTSVTSTEWRLTADGTDNILKFIWTYGTGEFQINKVILRTSETSDAQYFIKAEIHDRAGSSATAQDLYFGDAPTIESTGKKNIYEILNWDFTCIRDDADPVAKITWMSASDLPIQLRQISVSKIEPSFATPGVTGFDSFKWECLKRAEKSVQAAFQEEIRTTTGTFADFTTDGTEWTRLSTDNWMAMIETREPRLRVIPNVTTVRDGFQYEVGGGYVVYNGGTYSDGEIFNGTEATTFLTYGTDGALNQFGAFRVSSPVDLGQPAIMPLGLWFDESISTVRMSNEPSDQVPTLVACQPWMVEAGLYVAEDDFRSDDAVSSAPDSVTITVSAEPPEGGSVGGSGRYSIFDSVILSAQTSEGDSTTTYVEWGVDIAVAIDMSGSMNPAAPFIAGIVNTLNTSLLAAGIGAGAVPNKYAWVKWGGPYPAGSVHQDFTTYSTWASNPPEVWSDSNEDGYVGINVALSGLTWRTTGNVIRIIVLITDEDRNDMTYVTGGGTSAAQYASILNELKTTLSSGPVKLISVIQARLLDSNNNYVIGYKYGGKTYKADGAGGFTNGVGGHSYNLSGYKLPDGTVSRYEAPGVFGGDNLTSYPAVGSDDADTNTGAWDEYGKLAEDPDIRGQVWDFYQVRAGGVAATSLAAAMASALVEDVTLSVTTTFTWQFTGWYDQTGNLLSTSPTYAFAAVESQTITGRFAQV